MQTNRIELDNSHQSEFYQRAYDTVQDTVWALKDTDPSAVRFAPDPRALTHITLLIINNKPETYKTLIYAYGHCFAVALLRHLEKIEDFGRCAAIKAAIDQHNADLKDSLPTR